MDDSFSLLKAEAELCEEFDEDGDSLEVKHFVFEDLLDTSEKFICKRKQLGGGFCLYRYYLLKDSRSIFSRREERPLGCYLCYRDGTVLTFEDFNFKIQSFDEFTLLVEAIEVSSGISYFFELCNLCELPEKVKAEQDVALTLFCQSVKKLPPPTRFDQIADENREVLKLAEKGNDKALEKLERELGREETIRLLKEVREHPEELFDTYISCTENAYKVIGIVTDVKVVEVEGRKFLRLGILAEDLDFTVLTPVKEGIADGDRIEVIGKLRGVAVF
ncbi:hypothetical protein SAMN06265339_0445 [Desulfurobacterium pacificum]|uniref:Uncharacterized protein n=1 Tax=Desulfurobacterium pacificum TaxID=240166 RepID=A0ABY1NDM9_9BACT|nr:hypothetical protein [Desulfurobacterium pacificum]SMP07138.1 hypothetical protein SAMN06265339_0445 [Desulfurobacterium pacificum]